MKNVEDIYPLSPVQEGMLFHSLSAPQSGVYVNQMSFTLSGGLDVAAFRRAWEDLLDLHPILRTAFLWEGIKEPLQVVRQQVRLPWREEAWTDLPDADRRERLEALLEEERRRGFDLSKAPLMRLVLVELGQGAWHFVWTHHHLLLDGWSLSLVFRDLFALYEARRRGREPSPRPSPPYSSYIGWLKRQDLAEAERFWRGMLAGFTVPTPLDLRPPRSSPSGGHREHRCRLPEATRAALEALARRHHLTLNTLVAGAWAVLLGRYSGEEDVLFGVTVSGRPTGLPGVESMVGLFINSLPLRVRAGREEPLLPWLERLQALQAELRQYDFTPLVQAHRWSEVPGGTPLFSSLFVFENYPVDLARQDEAGGLDLRDLKVTESTNYPLNVLVSPAGGLALRVIYEARRFDPDAILRLAGHFTTLLEGLVQRPEAALGELPWLTGPERFQLVAEWNDTAAPAGDARCIQELFARRARQAPEATAVIFEEGSLTYGELARLANRLARHLRGLGIGRGDLVAVYMERSLEMVPALLGILTSGAAYVPLETSYPEARLEWILSSLGVRSMVTQSPRLETVAALAGGLPRLEQVVVLDPPGSAAPSPSALLQRLWHRGDLERLPADDLPSCSAPEDLAYVIFTSGSTGQPKGVVEQHAAVLNLIDWVNRTFAVGPADQVLFITSLCFDLSVFDVFGLLAAGGSIRVASTRDVRDPEHLVRLLVQEPVTFWDSAPAALQQLVPFLPPAAGGRLRLVFLSGDWIPVTLPDRLRASFPAAEVVSLGGATEATVWSNFHRIGAVDPAWVSIPYGRPIRNALYLILDAGLEPCPVGVAGDLYIGGECLASGYTRPELSAERFIPDPFAGRPGARLYRTGDRARFWPDGTMEFLGRRDHQVKVRGFRIELGEIETVLGEHPGVRDAVVVARQDEPGEKRLVAYVVPRQEPAPTLWELRRHLRDRLPEYMVPAAFVFLPSLPVTANGKLDRGRLQAPEVARPDLERPYVAPRGPAEQALAEIWAEVLGRDRVGIHDDFFELGGDSILSIRVISRARKAGLVVSPAQFFEHPTIAGLAAGLGETRPAEAEQGTVVGPLPLTPIQSWFFEQGLAEPQHWNQALLLEVRRVVSPSLLARVIERLTLHHDALRLRFERGDGGWEQVNAGHQASCGLTCVDLSCLPAAAWKPALEAVAGTVQASLDLSEGPLIRAVLFTPQPPEPPRLLLVVHHLAIDVVSWRILLEDLEAAYRQLASGVEVELPPKTTSYRAWAHHLSDQARSEEVRGELPYWLSEPRQRVSRLPVDYLGGANTVAGAAAVFTSLSAEDTHTLLYDVPEVYGTQINDVLLTALAQTFARWTGASSSLVDLERHGRDDVSGNVDLSRTVGWFTAVVPVVLDLEGALAPGSALKAIKEQLRRVPGRGLGHGLLRYLAEDAATREGLRTLPQAEVSFNYMGRFDEILPGSSPFQPADESSGPSLSPRGRRRYLLEIGAAVRGGRLQVSWQYGRKVHRAATVERLARDFLAALRSLIAHCTSPGAGASTPADFPDVDLDQVRLDSVLAEMELGMGEEG